MMTQDNVLVLDEPTNHLDLESISALAEGLQKYEGTVIVVTHDQELISEVATRIWALQRGQGGGRLQRALSTSSWRSTPTSPRSGGDAEVSGPLLTCNRPSPLLGRPRAPELY